MSEILSEFGLAILGAIFLVLADKVVRFSLHKIQLKPSAKFWKHWLGGDGLIICSTSGDREPYLTRGTGPFDCLTLQKLSSLLAEIAPGRSPPSNIEQYTDNWMDKNIISIGGPVNNHVSEEVLKKTSGLAYTFNDRENEIDKIAFRNLVVRKPSRPGDGNFTKDSGLLCHLPNPFSPEKHVMIIAGCWGQGTLGGTDLLNKQINEIWKRTNGDFFQVVYDVEIDNKQNPTNGKFDWDTLEILNPKPFSPDCKEALMAPLDQFNKKVSVVIPCRNEESTVANIVNTYKNHSAVGEIIVVDNDSTDNTSNNAKEAGARIISEKQHGKGYAMVSGIQNSNCPFIFFIDGDIENPEQEWLYMLLLQQSRLSLDVVRADPPYYPPLVSICVRPLLNILFKNIQNIRQPLGGIVLIKQEIAKRIHWHEDWGVDVGLTIHIAKNKLAYDEVRIGPIAHGERPENRRYEMSKQIIKTILDESYITLK